MSKKWKFWLRVAVASILFGVVLALLQLCLVVRTELDDYTLPGVIRFSAGLTLLCFVSAIGLVFTSWALSSFFRWLFTWRIIKRCLWALLILAAMVPVFYAEENWRGQRAWENYRHELEARGEKLDFAAYIPPTVPDDQNFAFAPVVRTTWNWLLDTNGHKLPQEDANIVQRLALNLFRTNQLAPPPPQSWQLGQTTDLTAWQNYYRTMFVTNRCMPGMPPPMLSESGVIVVTNLFNPDDTNEIIAIEMLVTNEFPVAAQPQTSAADVLLALSKFDAALAELQQAAAKPLSRFPLQYDADIPAAIGLPHYAAIKSCNLVLSLRADAELASGKTQVAYGDVLLMLRLNESIRTEPFLFAQEFRAQMFLEAMQPVWTGLINRKWTELQLGGLEVALFQFDFLTDYAAGVRSQCAADIHAIEYCRKTSNSTVGFALDDGAFHLDEWLDLLPYRLFPEGWYLQGKRTLSKAFYFGQLSGFNAEQRFFSPKQFAEATRRIYWEINQHAPWNVWSRMLLPDCKPSRFAETQTQLDLARLAIALERHRLANGAYPETLDALAPRFLEKIPHDVINGQPLHYRRTEDGKFLLYSVGWNETDDGGKPGLGERGNYLPAKGDWVWMFPQP